MQKEETILLEICGDEIEINKETFEDFENFVRSKYGRIEDELIEKELFNALRTYMEFKETGQIPDKKQ